MKKIILFITSFCITLIAVAQTSKTVNLTVAGTLLQSLTRTERNTISTITITGIIDARDFVSLRDSIPNLANIDMLNATISSYTGNKGTTFSSSYQANTIPQNAFYFDTKLSSIILPKTITTIDTAAFGHCYNLTKASFISSSLKTINELAFFNCSVTSLILPDSVIYIGIQCFASSNEAVYISSSVKNIDDEAFILNGALITVDTNNTNYSSIDGVLFSKKQDTLISYPQSKKGGYIIPSTVKFIKSKAFWFVNGLTSITIPSSITYLNNCFNGDSNLTSVTIPSSVTKVLNEFGFCAGLKSINLPNSVTSISGSFYQCIGLTSVTIPSSVTDIGEFTFDGCTGLTSINIPASVSSIGYGSFEYCTGLTSISIPSSIKSIGYEAFQHCTNLKTVYFPSLIDTVHDYIFFDCTHLQSVYSYNKIPFDFSLNWTTGVAYNAFYDDFNDSCTLYIPFGSLKAYKEAIVWKNFKHIVEMPGFTIDTLQVTLKYTTDTSTLNILSNIPVIISTNQPWLSFVKDSTKLMLIAKANNETTSRTALVIVSANGITDTITVSQSNKVIESAIEIITSKIKPYKIIGNTILFDNNNSSVYSLLGQCLSNDKMSITLPDGYYIIKTSMGYDKVIITR